MWTSADDPAVTLTEASHLAVDQKGNVFISEGGESVVYGYDPQGKFITKIGGRGGGPGEFRGNCCVAIDPKGRLWVRDVGAARYVVFTLRESNGRLSAAPSFVARMPHTDTNLWIALHFDRSGNYYDVGHTIDQQNPLTTQLRKFLVDSTGRVLREIRMPIQKENVSPPFKVNVTSGDSMVTSRTFYQPYAAYSLRADGPNGQFAIAGSGAYAIQWFSPDGSPLRTIRFDHTGPPLTEAEQRAATRDLERIAREARTTVQSLPFGVPARKPSLRSIDFDLEGRLWVEKSVPPGSPRESDVFLPDGTLAFTVAWPTLPKMVFRGTARGRTAWVTVRDADDIPSVVKVDFAAGR